MTLKERFYNEIKNMKLKERFYNLIKYMERAEECEKIADDYAIEFAEWTQDQDYRNDYDNCHLTMKQLLEIFKKEKGL
jgi:isoleucyl-tRNA synthetase